MPRLPRAKKSLGQNFLVDRNAADRYVRSLAPGEGARVLEIGPGRGAITKMLVPRLAEDARLVLIEKDDSLATALQRDYAQDARIDVLRGDVMLIDLGELAAGAPWLVLGNLPFNLAGRITMRLLELRTPEGSPFAERMVLGYQREVARRIAARAGDSAYGHLSVLVAALAETRLLFELPPEVYRPRPKVWTGVVGIRLREQPMVPLEQWESFRRLVRAAFTQRRKTIANSLRSSREGLRIEDPVGLLERAGIDPRTRAQRLDVSDFLRLFESFRSL